MAQAMRWAMSDYLNTGTEELPVWSQCGTGFNSLNEDYGTQVDSKIYINSKSSSKTIKSYETSFPFDTDMYNDEAAIMAIYNVARNQLTGSDAEMEYIRTDLLIDETGALLDTSVPARKFTVAVEVSSNEGDGGEALTISGNLNAVGTFTEGTFDLTTKTFTAKETV